MSSPNTEDHHSLPPPPLTTNRRHRASTRAKFGNSIEVNDSQTNLYDLDGDGKLDAIEQTMMKYDKDGDGTFSNEEIYDIIQEQIQAERNKKRMKTAVIGLSCFLMVLALSNLGTSFAAMFLSKELVADTDEGVMRLATSGELASVQSSAETLDLLPLSSSEYEARKLMVLRDLEMDPHSHAHRRLKNSKCGSKCDGDLMFDNGKMKEKDFRSIEVKCQQQKNVKIRRAKDFDRQSDSICSAGTSVVVKQKKGVDKSKGTRVKGNGKDREVIIVSSAGKRMNVDCVGDDCYVSGDLLLGGFGESCDRNRNDCEVHLICDSSYGKDASAQYGTCLYPRFVKTGGICDLHYLGEACERGSYCWSDKHVVYNTKESRVVNDGSSGVIRVGNSQNPRLLLGTKIGECLRQVGAGNLCNSPFACIDGFTCIGAGGIEIGLDPNSSGSVSGPSGTVSWNVEVNDGICM